jgi:uncharacterized protein YjeT (DUF2065 family)
MAKTISTILGVAFILVGLLGFIAPHMLGAHLSTTHNIIHLVSGAAALYFGLSGTLSQAKAFCLAFGAVYLLLGLVGFIAGAPGISTLHGMAGMSADDKLLKIIPGAFEVGTADHTIHIILGLVFLVGGLMTRATITPTMDRT